MLPELKLAGACAADEAVGALAWSPDGGGLLISPLDGDFLLLRPEQKKAERRWKGHGFGNGSGCFFGDGKVALPSHDGVLRIFSTDSVEPVRELKLGQGMIEKATASNDGERLAAACGKILHVFDSAFQKLTELPAAKKSVCDFAWHPWDSDRIAMAGDGGVSICEVESGGEDGGFQWNGASLRVIWSADTRWVVTADQTPSVHLLDCPRNFPLHIQGYPGKVKALAFSPCSEFLATGSGGVVTIWTCTGPAGPEGSQPAQIPAHDGECAALAWSPAGDLLATAGTDGALLLFERGKWERPVALAEGNSPAAALAWSPDGSRLAMGVQSGSCFVFNVRR